MRTLSWSGLAAIAAASTTLVMSSARASRAQQPATNRQADSAKAAAESRPPAPIQDNSFLIEEAYNQTAGVVQHISGFQRDTRGGAFVYQFTQEWPVGGLRNQFSYSLAFLRPGQGEPTGLGDTRLNYRYQLAGDGNATLALAPRLSAILPTGSYRRGRGAGAVGIEGNLPASLQLTEQFVVHGNLGVTVIPRARSTLGDRATTTAWATGASAIWLARPSFNLLVETLYQSTSEVVAPNQTARGSATTISPGLRWAHNFSSGLQVVPGIAVPIGVGSGHAPTAMFFYLSLEHPFTGVSPTKSAPETRRP